MEGNPDTKYFLVVLRAAQRRLNRVMGRDWKKWGELVVRIILGGLFVYAGVRKVIDPIGFLEAIRSFRILQDPWAAWVAMGLPWLEIAAGLGLVCGKFYQGALLVINALLVVFLGGILSAWARGLDIDCGCFGSSKAEVQYWDIVLRDLVMLAAGAWLWWCASKRKPAAEGAPGLAEAV